jgi:hypothetical protein
MPVWGPRLARLLGLVLLVGLSACGSPLPEVPVPGRTSGSTTAVGSLSVGDAPRAAPAPAPQASAPGARRSDAAGATSPAPAASSTNPPPSEARAAAEPAQYEARQQWLAELRESPDAGVRLQALALWAAHPDDDLEPLFEALGDDDEAVQARAEELWEQQLTQEETETQP